ncbi:MAG: cryptochrome/photolyase family protein [Pseudomonadota bacterium]
MTTARLIFPHQLFERMLDGAKREDLYVLIEEPLFFDDPVYPARFHKQKLAYHRATMKAFAQRLETSGIRWSYIETRPDKRLLEKTLAGLAADENIRSIVAFDPHDFVLNKRLQSACEKHGLDLTLEDSPGFLNTRSLNEEYRDGRKRWFMADFYKWQRKRLDILVDDKGEPTGGQWSFDADNRKKVAKSDLNHIPAIASRNRSDCEKEARDYVEANWPDNPGSLQSNWYPTTHSDAAIWLERFLNERFALFGDYEDAMVEGEVWLWHSVLTPMLNTGLLTPRQVVRTTLDYAEGHDVPLNALEGFLRQIIGWREFMRATYDDLGVTMRTTNHWQHTRPLPASFYDGTTGIDPIDDTIRRINDTAYCHHIERLMMLGGFMFLCEIEPDDIYRWFMEMFIDAYDWVMVPNVYAMSQNADGGLITTKPYFSGSAYIRKMSNWKAGEWSQIWDGLYWRWINNHADELAKNPRWAMMCSTAKRMGEDKMQAHIDTAEAFLAQLSSKNHEK